VINDYTNDGPIRIEQTQSEMYRQMIAEPQQVRSVKYPLNSPSQAALSEGSGKFGGVKSENRDLESESRPFVAKNKSALEIQRELEEREQARCRLSSLESAQRVREYKKKVAKQKKQEEQK